MPAKVQPKGMPSGVHVTVHTLGDITPSKMAGDRTRTKRHKNDPQLSRPTQKMPVWKDSTWLSYSLQHFKHQCPIR